MPRLLLVLGPTASGKTARAIQLAQEHGTHIISADSRQFYSELDIGVARPSPDELAAAPHHFIACRSVLEPYNVFTYQQEALALTRQLFQQHDTLVAVGGSSLYIQALTRGINVLPDPTPELRASLQRQLHDEGIQSLRALLKSLDPDYYARVDLANPIRIQRALEVCLTAGEPYSRFLDRPTEPRDFTVEPVIIERSRKELRERILSRVDQMFDDGLEAEARSLYPLRHLQPLNTVGYKEFFSLWPQSPSPLSNAQRQQVADSIALNTWHYAKKQLTWLKKARAIYNF
ncbi:MAG: tRNA (adenosine(37)-N6)-dimethylallyltransferase MiaA [Bacteroidales bacterium]|nr:tRNA (adenosine(37)-N6)-dimethylallyltransferase MiaA [Bacteroidales bacterium]